MKNSMVLGRSPYQWQHEPVLFGWLLNGQHRWFAGKNQSTIWQYDKPKRSKDHPTMKPIPLLAYPLQNSSAPNAVVLDTFGGSDKLPIYDRLFLGGPRSIRGVEYRDIAPRVWKRAGKKGSYEPWGGQTSWCGTFEYTVPIVKYVRVAAFTDFGSVGEDEFDFDSRWFCWSVGFGLRLDIEQFPIRLDFATPVVEPDDDADKEFFSFSIGYDF